MNNRTPEEFKEELKHVIDQEIDKLQEKINNSPWKVYPDPGLPPLDELK